MTDFQRQKDEAANRVRRMNEEYRRKAGLNKAITEKEKPKDKTPMDFLKMFRFDSMKNDPDRLVIMCVFLLLSREKCDEKLLYALLYIMM